jgi:hypothetical protein
MRPVPSSETAGLVEAQHRGVEAGGRSRPRGGRSGGDQARLRRFGEPSRSTRASAVGGLRPAAPAAAARAASRDAVAQRLGECAGRDRGEQLLAVEAAKVARVGDLTDDGVRELQRLHASKTSSIRSGRTTRPLLALGDHHLPGLEVVLAERHAVEAHVDAGVAGHLRQGRGEPGRAAVLQRLDQSALDQLA